MKTVAKHHNNLLCLELFVIESGRNLRQKCEKKILKKNFSLSWL